MFNGNSLCVKTECVFVTSKYTTHDLPIHSYLEDNPYSYLGKNVYYITDLDVNLDNFQEEVNFIKRQKEGSAIIVRLNKTCIKSREGELLETIATLYDLLTFDVPILIETGKDIRTVGSTIEDLAFILKRLNNLKVFIHTANVFQAGYPIHKPEHLLKYFVTFEMKIGLDKIGLCFLSESTYPPFNYPLMPLFTDTDVLDIYGLMSNAFCIGGRAIPEYHQEELEILFKTFIILSYIKKYIKRYEIFNQSVVDLIVLKNLVTSIFRDGNYRLMKIDNNYHFNFNHPLGDSFLEMLNNNTFFFSEEEKYRSLKELLNYDCFQKSDLSILASNNIFSIENLKDLSITKRRKILTKDQQNLITNFKFVRNIDFNTASDIASIIIANTRNKVCGIFYNMVKIERRDPVPKMETLCILEEKEYNIKLIMDHFVHKSTIYTSQNKMTYILSFNKKFFVLEMNFCTTDTFKRVKRRLSYSREIFKRLKELELAQ